MSTKPILALFISFLISCSLAFTQDKININNLIVPDASYPNAKDLINAQAGEPSTLKSKQFTFASNQLSPDSIIFYNYSSETDSVLSSKTTYSYNINGNPSLTILYSWDSANNKWINQSKGEQTFDDNDNLITYYSYSWDSETSNWINENNSEHEYDGYNNETLQTIYLRKASTNEWLVQKNAFQYDENNNLIAMTSFKLKNDNWVELSKTATSYNSDNQLISKTYYNWNSTSGNLLESRMEEYSYESNSNTTFISYYNWDTESNDWLLSQEMKSTDSYNTNDDLILKLKYAWDNTLNTWQLTEKYEYSYDDFGNLISDIYIWQVPGTDDWLGGIRKEYRFDNSYNQILYAGYYWNGETKDWDISHKSFYCYVTLTTSSNDFIVSHMNIYPNPVSDYITINLPKESSTGTLELYNIQGKKVFSTDISNSKPICLDGIEAGIYLYSLTVDGQKQTGKLVKN